MKELATEKLMKGIALLLADYEAQLRSDRVKRGMLCKIEHGLSLQKPPLGYTPTNVSGLYKPDELGLEMKRLIAAYIKGSIILADFYIEIKQALNKTTGRTFTYNDIYKLLTNPYYSGSLKYCGKYYPGVHQPLLAPKDQGKIEWGLFMFKNLLEKDDRASDSNNIDNLQEPV